MPTPHHFMFVRKQFIPRLRKQDLYCVAFPHWLLILVLISLWTGAGTVEFSAQSLPRVSPRLPAASDHDRPWSGPRWAQAVTEGSVSRGPCTAVGDGDHSRQPGQQVVRESMMSGKHGRNHPAVQSWLVAKRSVGGDPGAQLQNRTLSPRVIAMI